MNPHLYGKLIYDKGGKTIQRGKNSFFNKWCWENWTATCKRTKLDYSLTPSTKVNSKWIQDLNVRPETIKLLEENIGITIFDKGLTNTFLDMSPQARETKAKINKCNHIKLKVFAQQREPSTDHKNTTYRLGENICK